MTRSLFAACIGAVTIMTACASSRPYVMNKTKTGAIQPAKPATCEIEFVQLSSQEVVAENWQPIGKLMIEDNGFTEKAKGVLRPLACEWGGDAVNLVSADKGYDRYTSMFMVLKKKQ